MDAHSDRAPRPSSCLPPWNAPSAGSFRDNPRSPNPSMPSSSALCPPSHPEPPAPTPPHHVARVPPSLSYPMIAYQVILSGVFAAKNPHGRATRIALLSFLAPPAQGTSPIASHFAKKTSVGADRKKRADSRCFIMTSWLPIDCTPRPENVLYLLRVTLANH